MGLSLHETREFYTNADFCSTAQQQRVVAIRRQFVKPC
jgi:hypothetical protein